MDELLAKSPKGDRTVTLVQHTQDVVDAAEALFGSEEATRLGKAWLRFFKLTEENWSNFRWNLLASCLLHDWGKANDGFQKMVRGKGEQAIRHEHFSALLIGLPIVTAWLKQNANLDVPLVLSAVLTHHLKASGKADGFASVREGIIVRLVDYGEGFQSVLKLTAKRLNPPGFDIPTIPTSWTGSPSDCCIRDHRKRGQDILLSLEKDMRTDVGRERKRLLLAVRAALIAADAAGSGLVRVGNTVADWVQANVSDRQVLTKDELNQELIEKRVADLTKTGKWHDKGDGNAGWSEFQLNCDHLPDRALLLAPCGSGKTLAAWRWVAAQLKERPAGHVLFLYPTRATAREGFKDYVSWAPEAGVALMHGTSEFDLQDMFANTPVEDPRKKAGTEVEKRLFSLAYWPRRVFSATVDQFLAFMQYGYGPMCVLPVLADSVVVIDEVHSFDKNMFGALKDFLKNFDVPVLCMTATLPIDRRNELTTECGLKLEDGKPGELETIANAPRYRLVHEVERDKVADEVAKALKQGKRVLWVVNTVKRAHAVLAQFVSAFDPGSTTALKNADNVPVFAYHSRFKLSDRTKRHSDVVDSLKADQPGALGVTTQVCEMSLDIDVDLLVTEACPVTALIQRMGRCNRIREPRPLSQSGTVIVYKPENEKPYAANDLVGLREFLTEAAGRELSQTELERIMLSVPNPAPVGDPLSRFLESGAYAVGGDDEGDGFRDTDDFNRPCVLARDRGKFVAATVALKPGYILPVPRGKVFKRDDHADLYARLPGYLGVADDGHYHPLVGFCDFPLVDWNKENK